MAAAEKNRLTCARDSLQQRLFKTGGRLVRHARWFVLQLAEGHLTRRLFGQILGRIERLVWHLILNTGQGAAAMSSGGRPGGGVSERPRGSDQTRKHRVAQAPGFTRRTAINLSGGLNELTDGTVCSVDVPTVMEIGPYRKSRPITDLPAGATGPLERLPRLLDGTTSPSKENQSMGALKALTGPVPRRVQRCRTEFQLTATR